MSIGKNIKALREKQGLSQVELAKKIGVTDIFRKWLMCLA